MSDPTQPESRDPAFNDWKDGDGPSILFIVGVLVILVGLGGLGFALGFDTTVPSSDGDAIHNNGLLNDRLVYAITAGFTLLFGVGLAGLGRPVRDR